MKYPTPSQAIDALIGEEEQNGKQKRAKRKKQGAGPQPSYPGPFIHLLRCEERERDRGTRGETPNPPSRATNELIGDEEQNKKRRKEQRERKQ